VPWFKVDDAFHGHPKVMELSPAAVGVWTLAGSWCANYLTDGEIKAGVVRRFGADDAMIQELVNAGLWIDIGGAYQFKDWDEYQPLKEEVEAERNAARDRMKAVRAKKKGVERSPEQPANVHPNNTGTFGGTSEEVRVTPSLPAPSHPDPSSSRRSPERSLPEDWKPNVGHQEKAAAKHLDVRFLAESFRNHAATNDRRARDWDAAFRNWILKATPGTPPAARNISAQYSWANQ
jgi:hypothetical protein